MINRVEHENASLIARRIASINVSLVERLTERLVAKLFTDTGNKFINMKYSYELLNTLHF